MIVTGKSLSRRTVLKGLGTTIALPFLDAMTPAFAHAAASTGPIRLAWFYVPNGIDMRHWTPAADGTLGTLPAILSPLEPIKDEILVLSNLTTHWGRPLQDGAGDHGRALGSYMTGAQVFKTAGADLKLGISADQIAAEAIGRQTRLPSWKTETQPWPPISDPRALFERLFGSDANEPAAARARRIAMRQSILDEVLGTTNRLKSALGGTDRRKLDEYLTSLREIEQQVDRAAAEGTVIEPGIDKPFGVPIEFPDYFRLMTDMMVLAFKADVTRISTMIVGREGSVRAYPEIGVNDGHHPLTHHQGNMDMLAKVRQINELHARLFAEFLIKMKNTPEGDSNLLDQSMIVYGSGLSDGNVHTHDQLPTVLAGRGGGFVAPGRHIIYQRETPVTNLFLTMLHRVGVPPEHVGDSTGRLPGISLS